MRSDLQDELDCFDDPVVEEMLFLDAILSNCAINSKRVFMVQLKWGRIE